MNSLKSLDKKTILLSLGIVAAWFGFAFLISSIPLHPSLFADWPYFQFAGKLILEHQPLYHYSEAFQFFNPPWVAVLVTPFNLFPPIFAAGLVTAISITICFLLGRKYQFSVLSTVLFILSPPVMYVLYMGQIDLLILGGLLLPMELSPIVAISKPQLALGMAFFPFIHQSKLKKSILISAGILTISVIFFGLWFIEILTMDTPQDNSWNLWLHIWPWNLIPGILMLGWGFYKKDDLILLAASPFLFPYSTISSFIGIWLAIHQRGKNWGAIALFLISWPLFLWLRLS